MKNKFINTVNLSIFVFAAALIFSVSAFAQKQKTKAPTKKIGNAKANKVAAQSLKSPKVTQIDAATLKNLFNRNTKNAKPLLVNFWATWCDPCREEFPELVKIDSEYENKIDFITISVDDLAEIKREVPRFLAEMKATMPTFLLKTPDEEAAIRAVYKDWKGGYPFTLLFDANGEIVYNRQGKVEPEILRSEINKLLPGEITKPPQ